MENTEKQSEIGGWEDYTSHNVFLKASDVKENDVFEIKQLENYWDTRDNEPSNVLRLTLLINTKEWIFDLNKTNAGKLQELSKVTVPSDLKGLKIKFKKVLVRNPKTNQEVEGLRISELVK